MKMLRVVVVMLVMSCWWCSGEVWEKDMTGEIYIENSQEGFNEVELECSETHMELFVDMEEDFDGIIYTRGSFMEKEKGCYYDAIGGTEHSMSIPLAKCGIKADSDQFLSQTVIIQHDDWLIFPGDLAFTLQCKKTDKGMEARIGLADPDPSAKELPKHKKSTVEGLGTVTFTPGHIRPRKNKHLAIEGENREKREKRERRREKKEEL